MKPLAGPSWRSLTRVPGGPFGSHFEGLFERQLAGTWGNYVSKIKKLGEWRSSGSRRGPESIEGIPRVLGGLPRTLLGVFLKAILNCWVTIDRNMGKLCFKHQDVGQMAFVRFWGHMNTHNTMSSNIYND